MEAASRRRADPDAADRVNARTLFARLQQFAGRLYGPLIAAGIAWWTAPRAITGAITPSSGCARLRRIAGLPEICGRKPFGGHILSHDFVEAALMRRAGWAIHDGADARRLLRGMPPFAAGFRRARPALVSGQPPASGDSAGARASLGVAASPAHRHRVVPDRPALADLSGVRNPDFAAGAVRQA